VSDATDAWSAARASAVAGLEVAAVLGHNPTTFVDSVRSSLASPEERLSALGALGILDPSWTLAVLPEVVAYGVLSHRHALVARRLLGRIAEAELTPALDAVWLAREPSADYDEWRRIAEAFKYTGLHSSLARLTVEALTSSDPNIREVGEDYRSSAIEPSERT